MAECSEQICMFKAGRLADGVNMLLLNCYLTPALWSMNTTRPTDGLYALQNVRFIMFSLLLLCNKDYLSEVSLWFRFHDTTIA